MKMAEYREVYGEGHDIHHSVKRPYIQFVLATTPRTGSTWIAHELWRSGCLGVPLEYLNPIVVRHMSKRLKAFDLATYIEGVMQVRTTSNGIFGCKAFLPHLASAVANGFPVPWLLDCRAFIFLRRKDKLAQAISLSRARQDGLWVGRRDASTAQYDPAHIASCFEEIAHAEDGWQRLLATLKAPVIECYYEDLVACGTKHLLESAVKMLHCTHTGQEAVDVPTVVTQVDEISHNWRGRYVCSSSSHFDAGINGAGMFGLSELPGRGPSNNATP